MWLFAVLVQKPFNGQIWRLLVSVPVNIQQLLGKTWRRREAALREAWTPKQHETCLLWSHTNILQLRSRWISESSVCFFRWKMNRGDLPPRTVGVLTQWEEKEIFLPKNKNKTEGIKMQPRRRFLLVVSSSLGWSHVWERGRASVRLQVELFGPSPEVKCTKSSFCGGRAAFPSVSLLFLPLCQMFIFNYWHVKD